MRLTVLLFAPHWLAPYRILVNISLNEGEPLHYLLIKTPFVLVPLFRLLIVDYLLVAKTLFYNVTCQARVPAAIPSVDASNCYDRIAHTMASLVFQALGVPESAIGLMLSAIGNMKFFPPHRLW
jgi:hypothetical protein